MADTAEIAIVMGSDSDLGVMKDAAQFLDEIGVSYMISIVSAHRTPERMYEFARDARTKGFRVIIAGAGGSAHLPGMIAALTAVPVIGVPVKGAAMSGIDSLYSIVQMPPGIPVATVAINGAKNAAILACEILAASDDKLYGKIAAYKESLRDMVYEKAARLEEAGWKNY